MIDVAPGVGPAMTRRSLMETAAGMVFLASARNGQGKPAPAKPVFQHDLPEVTLKGWSVTAVEVTYQPGESSTAHRHPGITIAYVLEGEIRSKVGDGPERVYKVGEMFFENPRELHAVSANASATKPARLLAILLAERGQPRTAPA